MTSMPAKVHWAVSKDLKPIHKVHHTPYGAMVVLDHFVDM